MRIKGYAEVEVDNEFRQWLETLIEIRDERLRHYMKLVDEHTREVGWLIFKYMKTDDKFRQWLWNELEDDIFFWVMDFQDTDKICMRGFAIHCGTIMNLIKHSDKVLLDNKLIESYIRLRKMMREDVGNEQKYSNDR